MNILKVLRKKDGFCRLFYNYFRPFEDELHHKIVKIATDERDGVRNVLQASDSGEIGDSLQSRGLSRRRTPRTHKYSQGLQRRETPNLPQKLHLPQYLRSRLRYCTAWAICSFLIISLSDISAMVLETLSTLS